MQLLKNSCLSASQCMARYPTNPNRPTQEIEHRRGRRRRFLLVFIILLCCSCFINFSVGQVVPGGSQQAARLPDDEVEALKEIANTLRKTNWNLTVNPCSGESGWSTPGVPKEVANSVTCNCTFVNKTVCHVTEIVLKSQNLQGVLPPELVKLPYLQIIDLTRNYLNGTIPNQWGSMQQLKKISLLANRLSGWIPKEIGNITSLIELSLEYNQLSGVLPPELGKLVGIQKIVISSNKFTGLPDLSGLTNLKDFRISDNLFTGKLPNFIEKWTKLEKLEIQASGFEGPIPSGISLLENLNDMRISDLNGTEIAFPLLNNMKKMRRLILRSCNITGVLPPYIGEMPLKLLDLSFNKLTGIVPDSFYSFASTQDAKFLYLTGNSLSGSVPVWMLEKGNSMDLSYNNFNSGPSYAPGCQQRNVNLFKGFSLGNTSTEILPCSKSCPRDGNYNVTLHFAEIMFRNDNTFYSLGRRIFDVYIQGQRVLKDFNIAEEAGGVGKEFVKTFSTDVTSNTLEIRFYWAGKGTTGIPVKGTYGPLISAISVKSNFEPPIEPPFEDGKKISAGAVVGIVASVLCLIFMVLGILWWKGCLRRKNEIDEELRGLDLNIGSFTLRQIKAATNNFNIENKIGEGGFGPVYKGLLSDGTKIAVKQLSSISKQGSREFVNEIGLISALQHPNLVKLYGCCIEGNHLLLVYEYMENNSLANALFGEGPEECRLNLDWPARHKICVGIARGLAYLHEESRLKVVHRDIKATNVLLDKDLHPKISDFGLAKLDEEGNTHISTKVAGTLGYMAPEYAMRGYLTDKADVYSFGIVALEIVSGRSNANNRQKEDGFHLLDWALLLQKSGSLMELVDPRLGSDFSKEEVLCMAKVALLCTNVSPTARPLMSSVVSMLEGRTGVQAVSKTDSDDDELKFQAVRDQYQQNLDQSVIDSQTQCMLVDGPLNTSSTSGIDLYPIQPDTQYWNNRSE